MGFVVPALAAIGGGSALAGAATLAATAGSVYGAVQSAKRPEVPAIANPMAATPEKPPAPTRSQGAQSASRGAALAGNLAAASAGGALSGNSGTFLTGPSGVDAASLNLGKNKLLGQ